jgi:hypothetical protein
MAQQPGHPTRQEPPLLLIEMPEHKPEEPLQALRVDLHNTNFSRTTPPTRG